MGEERIRVELEIGQSDMTAFYGLLPDELVEQTYARRAKEITSRAG